MFRRLLVLFVLSGVILSRPCLAADEFSKNNPDIKKYAFAHSYITALSYMKDIDNRWHKNASKRFPANQKNKMILATINDLTLDSSDLFIIKDYLIKYLTSPNMLIRKVADMVVVATSREIAINHDEKRMWEKWYNLNITGKVTKTEK